MRYLVTARLRRGRRDALRRAIDEGTLGAGSVAGGEYLHDMAHARELDDGRVKWVETCFCATPLAEERDYWEEFFDLISVKDAHARSRCRDENGTDPWACCGCDCTERLEGWLGRQGRAFEP
jgi:DMSO/TMAO reductase YedYZ molybdopterin-dependent catalytic subunit